MGKHLDKWEEALELELEKLKRCQSEQGYKSCLPCPKLNNCQLRGSYVNAVYESMNKGEGGGFEF